MEHIELELSKQMLLGELLARWSRKNPDGEALVYDDTRVTYARLNERVNRLANALKGRGVSRGAKVAVLFTNCLEILECYFAAAKIGAVAVPLNYRLVDRELVYQLNHSDAEALIYQNQYREMVQQIRPELPAVHHFICTQCDSDEDTLDYEEFLSTHRPNEPLVMVEDDDPVMMMYTSGTTGKPKGVVLTHKNLVSATINTWLEMIGTPDHRYLCIPPLFHLASTCTIFKLLFIGGTSVILDGFDPDEVLAIIEKEQITYLMMVPAMWIRVLESPNISHYDKQSLKMLVNGGAVLPSEIKKKVMQHFPDAILMDTYGMTEMSPNVTSCYGADTIRKPKSVGRPLPHVEARIVDLDGRDVPVGEVGEAVFRGPNVMKEYYKNPEATAEALKGGWLHSGDLVSRDEEGFFYMEGRLKDMIISGGENIYAVEIEDVLYALPEVQEAAVIGIPDEKWGETVKAVIVLKEGAVLSADDIIIHCRKHLASYKKPTSIEFLQELPKGATGKILKTELRARYNQ